MSVTSMTGYGRAEGRAAGWAVRVEARSLNLRGREISVRMYPADLSLSIEEEVRRTAESAVARGRVDVRVEVSGRDGAGGPRLDRAAATAWVRDLRALARALRLDEAPSLALLARLPGVVVASRPAAERAALLSQAQRVARKAIGNLVAARRREGARLGADLKSRLGHIRDEAASARALAPAAADAQRSRVRDRLTELLASAGASVDPGRVIAEAVLAVQRTDSTEELVRLGSHVVEAARTLAAGGTVGRRLDFLAQEMMREAQTLAAKTQEERIARHSLAIREEIERFREQVQNLE